MVEASAGNHQPGMTGRIQKLACRGASPQFREYEANQNHLCIWWTERYFFILKKSHKIIFLLNSHWFLLLLAKPIKTLR